MSTDPFAPQLLIDYSHFCERFGPMPFREFVAMWHAADALMTDALDAGFSPSEVPDLLITANNRRMEFLRSAIACFRPNIGRMRSRDERVRRWRTTARHRAVRHLTTTHEP